MATNIARIGANVGALALVSSLNSNNMPGPIMEFKKYAKYDELSNGHTNGGGLPIVEWEFRRLTVAQIDALRAFCTSMTSAAVTIYTRTNSSSDAYKAFDCIMKWDQAESITMYWRDVIRIRFIDCVEVEYTPP